MATVPETNRANRCDHVVLTGIPWDLHESLRDVEDIRNEARVRGQEAFDLVVDPPPDLVVEVEVSRGATRRMRLYGALGVPEVWRFKRSLLRAYERTAEGEYVEREFSVHLPFLRLADLVPFLGTSHVQSETAREKLFQTWVREKFGPEGTRAP